MSFDSRSQRRIAKSVRHTEKNLTPAAGSNFLAAVPEGGQRFFKMTETIQSGDDPKNANMMFLKNDGTWKVDDRDVKVSAAFFPNGKKLSSGANCVAVKSGNQFVIVGPQECFEDV